MRVVTGSFLFPSTQDLVRAWGSGNVCWVNIWIHAGESQSLDWASCVIHFDRVKPVKVLRSGFKFWFFGFFLVWSQASHCTPLSLFVHFGANDRSLSQCCNVPKTLRIRRVIVGTQIVVPFSPLHSLQGSTEIWTWGGNKLQRPLEDRAYYCIHPGPA